MPESPSEWLVLTKLQPPVLRADTMERPRLLDALRDAVSTRPVTLVSAPAGYGKTTLLASLPRVAPAYRQAWVSLDAEENDPSRFLSVLIGALQRLNPGCGERARSLISEADPRQVVGLLINEIVEQLPQPLLLVLDDLHFVTEPRVYLALEYLVDHLPPQMRLVIGTRHDPPLPLARLAARRQLAEIRRNHLSFTPAEAAQFLNEVLGLHLPDADLAGLQARTEGWAAGLCLLASSLEQIDSQDGRAALLTGLAETERYIFEFLAGEVLDRQGPEVREFLLQTSILPEMTPDLCRAVSGRPDAQALLESLYRRNLFLVRVESGAYRYHALFAEFLQEVLQREMAGQVPDLHRRAAEAQASPLRAIGHYLAAGLWAEAARAIEQVGERALLLGMMETIRCWGEALPASVRDSHPYLMLLLARAAIQRGDLATARQLAARAQEAYAAAGDAVREGAALSTRLIAIGLTDNFRALRELVNQGLATEPSLPVKARLLPARIWLDLYDLDWEQGAADLIESITLTMELGDPRVTASLAYSIGPLFAVLPGVLPEVERFSEYAATQAPDPASPLMIACGELRSFTALMRGHLDTAAAAGEAAIALKERVGGFAWLGLYALLYLATVQAARGEREAAERCLDRLLAALDRAPGSQNPLWLYGAGRTYWMLGKPEQARRLYERLQQIPPSTAFQPAPLLPRLSGMLALTERRLGDAERDFAQAVEMEATIPLVGAVGTARVLLARAHLERNRPEEALAALRPALIAAEEQGTPGLLLQEGMLALPALRLAATAGGAGSALAARVVELLGGPQAEEPPGTAAALPELLTQREVDVLRLLAAGATNREIAEALIVGEETVKTHVARILRKLDATSRTQAAARGRELGLV